MQVTNQAVVVRGLTAMCLSFTILAGAVHPARARAAADTSFPGPHVRQFRHRSPRDAVPVLRSAMLLHGKSRPLGTEWGKFPNGFPYLYQVSDADRRHNRKNRPAVGYAFRGAARRTGGGNGRVARRRQFLRLEYLQQFAGQRSTRRKCSSTTPCSAFAGSGRRKRRGPGPSHASARRSSRRSSK